MQITRYPNARAFLDHTRRLFLRHEAESGLAHGLSLRLIDEADPDPDQTLFLAISDDEGQPLLTAIRIGRPSVIVFGDPDRWQLAEARALPAIRKFYPEVAALQGPKEQIQGILEAAGQLYETIFNQGLYRLDHLIPPKPCPGNARQARKEDLDHLVEWSLGFEEEAMGEKPTRNAAENATRERIADGKLWVWENGSPVSMAVQTRPTGKGVCIGYVYTPPEHRGKGYAGNLTAALTKSLLEEQGFEFCTLFTDLANATSNKIYQSIGYRKIMDFINVKLKP